MDITDAWEALAEVQVTKERVHKLLNQHFVDPDEAMRDLVAEIGDFDEYNARLFAEWLGY